MKQPRYKTPPKSKKGMVVKHIDGRVGRTFHHNRDVKGKLLIYFEETKGKKDFREKAVIVDPIKLKIIGFIN